MTNDDPVLDTALLARWQQFAGAILDEGFDRASVADVALTVALQLNTSAYGQSRATCHVLQVGAMMANLINTGSKEKKH